MKTGDRADYPGPLFNQLNSRLYRYARDFFPDPNKIDPYAEENKWLSTLRGGTPFFVLAPEGHSGAFGTSARIPEIWVRYPNGAGGFLEGVATRRLIMWVPQENRLMTRTEVEAELAKDDNTKFTLKDRVDEMNKREFAIRNGARLRREAWIGQALLNIENNMRRFQRHGENLYDTLRRVMADGGHGVKPVRTGKVFNG